MIVFVKKCFILTEGGCHLIFTCSKITIYELSFSKLKYHIRQLFSLEHLIYRWNINIIQKKIGFIYILVLPATFEKQRDNFVLRDNFGPYCNNNEGQNNQEHITKLTRVFSSDPTPTIKFLGVLFDPDLN